MQKVAPYGTWQSSISGEFLASRSVRLGEPRWHGPNLYWLEGRPSEKGRQTIMCRFDDGHSESILPSPWNARSKVHEYGGGNYCITDQYVYFVNADDQQIYTLNLTSKSIQPLTSTASCRYADLFVDTQQQFLYAVCEEHRNDTPLPLNQLIRLPLGGNRPAQPETIEAQHDFVSNPRISPNGQWLSYLTWDNPQMPWDASQVWLRSIDQAGNLGPALLVAGSGEESLFQPQWSPNGELFWVSDASNWWNLKYLPKLQVEQLDQNPGPHAGIDVLPMSAEFATPQWVFGMSTYCFLDQDTILTTYTQNGAWHLLTLSRDQEQWVASEVVTDCNTLSHLYAADGIAALVGAGATHPPAIFEFDGKTIAPVTPLVNDLAESEISTPMAVSFATENTATPTAFGFYYAPQNSQYQAPEGTLPPLIVVGHGGPTGSCDPSFNYKVQFWTQRGFAIMDVNYRGSTGYGRQFRHALQGAWGIADVEDLSNAARHAVAEGWAAPEQLIIRGSSAGGYSVLAALTDTDTFNAGVTLYGIGDLELLAKDTHKFEARYLDGLVGPYPEAKDEYIRRSPIHKIANISCPLLVFQGLQDKVVPPNQAETIVKSVSERGIPVAYVTYPEEGHGFRSAENICHQVEAEWYFYKLIFGLEDTPSAQPPIEVLNWPKL